VADVNDVDVDVVVRDDVIEAVVVVTDGQWYRVHGNLDLISRIGQSTGYLSTSVVNFIKIHENVFY
jgi:hypothetical protein